MQLYLVRHTETNYNVLGLCNSNPDVDVHLTPKGREQAKKLATDLDRVEFDMIYVSELPRAVETVKYITKGRSVQIKSDSRLNDLDTGHEGRPVDEYNKRLLQASDIWSVKFNDGESLLDLSNKIASFLSDLTGRSYKNVLIVSHHTVIQLMIGQVKRLVREEVLRVEIVQGQYSKVKL